MSVSVLRQGVFRNIHERYHGFYCCHDALGLSGGLQREDNGLIKIWSVLTMIDALGFRLVPGYGYYSSYMYIRCSFYARKEETKKVIDEKRAWKGAY